MNANHAPRSAVYRAELIRQWDDDAPEEWEAFARSLGFRPRAKIEVERVEHEATEDEGQVQIVPSTSAPSENGELPLDWPLWRVTEFEPSDRPPQYESPAWFKEAVPFKGTELLADRSILAPQPPALMPWRKLWVFLRRALGRLQPHGPLNTEALVDQVARGCWPRQLPRHIRLRWEPRACLIVDFRSYLEPIHGDIADLLGRLDGIRPSGGLDLWIIPEDDSKNWFHVDSGKRQAFSPPREPMPVLVLGDLGLLEHNQDEQGEWLKLGRELLRKECLPIALVPLASDRWSPALARTWRMVYWSEQAQLPNQTEEGILGQRFRKPTAPKNKEILVNQLLTLMAPALLIEPELLRQLRHLLGKQANIDEELAVWNHSHVEPYHEAVAITAEYREQYRAAFADPKIRPLAEAAYGWIDRYHQGCGASVRFEERMEAERRLGMSNKETEVFFQRFAKTVRSDQGDRADYMTRFAERRDEAGWQYQEAAKVAWLQAHAINMLTGTVKCPTGLDPRELRWAIRIKRQWNQWQLVWQGSSLCFTRGDRPEASDWQTGSRLLQLDLEDPLVGIRYDADTIPSWFDMNHAARVMTCDKATFTLSTSRGSYRIRSEKPEIGAGFYFDNHGLGMSLANGAEYIPMRWLPPGPIEVISGGERVGTWQLTSGCWLEEDQWWLFAGGRFNQPRWTQAVGVDDYGLYADWEIKGVRQRFRWILPNTFMMGSPNDEPKREDDELINQVTLARGFWLADTACRQELWTAVTGTNPSFFKGEQRPIESISWDDVQAFLKRLGEEPSGFGLPSEAQWEYACRAGTTTAFAWGEAITTEEVNYDGNNPLEGSPKGAYREEPVEVTALPANHWGLYQMHGNVNEWCEDWFGDFQTGSRVNPRGPASGLNRVLRGGSWYSVGWNCRSAYRYGYTPDRRGYDIGFRLARGQAGSKQKTHGRTEAGDRSLSGHGRRDNP